MSELEDYVLNLFPSYSRNLQADRLIQLLKSLSEQSGVEAMIQEAAAAAGVDLSKL